jgi:hypothetical protein
MDFFDVERIGSIVWAGGTINLLPVLRSNKRSCATGVGRVRCVGFIISYDLL